MPQLRVMKKIILLLLLTSFTALGQDTLKVGHLFKAAKNLELGVQKDAIYTMVNGRINSASIKIRETKMVSINGKDYLSFTHHSQSGRPEFDGWFEYICEPETLKPVQHIRRSKRAGNEAFSFSEELINGLDSANDNKQKDFELKLNEPTYNWEIDIETYSLLPMKEGYHAVMNFYHPGASTPPNYYHLKVIGSEEIVLPDKRTMDCWIVFTDYGGTQPTRFWYTKKGQNFVKMEGKYNQLTILKERIF